MKSNTKTLTEGPLAKQIFLVSLPLALSNLLQVLFKSSYPRLLLKGNCRVKQKRQLSKAVFLVVQ